MTIFTQKLLLTGAGGHIQFLAPALGLDEKCHRLLHGVHRRQIHGFVVCHFSTPFAFTIPHCAYIHNIDFGIFPYNKRICGTGGVNAIFDYSPLWETMRRNGVSQYYLLQNGIDNKTLDSLKKNRNITMVTLEKLCCLVGCTPNDVVRIIP